MNLWDFKRFRLNDPALAYVYKSQETLVKPVGIAGWEIHGEMGAWSSRGKRKVGENQGGRLPLLLAVPGV